MKKLLASLIIVLILFAIFIGAIFVRVKIDINQWNNGKCECGGSWELQGTHYQGNSHNIKFYDYQCDNCGKYIDCINQMEIERR
jgi:hypothetical protein